MESGGLFLDLGLLSELLFFDWIEYALIS